MCIPADYLDLGLLSGSHRCLYNLSGLCEANKLNIFVSLFADGSKRQAIPHITSQFHSLSDVAWYGSAYQLTRYISPCVMLN